MPHPLLFEINTRCWLRELAQTSGRPVTLADVPDSEFLSWQRLGFTHVWLMGAWTGGPRARAQALANQDLRRACAEALPDWTEQDVAASPYAVAAYQVPQALGGNDGLVRFRRRLQSFGLKLLLDFVPNHLGLDHPWVKERPELFVQSPTPRPETFAEDTPSGRRYLAHGKDPNWAAWSDTVQLDYRSAATRQAMIDLLREIAGWCDGVRCDMAMLLLNEVFARTWKGFPVQGSPPAQEFWTEAISTIRRSYPEFLFLAEVYWGLEPRLQALGFDYTYDKTLYDLLVARAPGGVQRHVLGLGQDALEAGAHFLENHDEPRIASLLAFPEHRAAALVILGLPGMRFLHEGQLQGARKRLPVQLIRRALEPVDANIAAMYDQLLEALRGSAVGRGTPLLRVPRQAWQGNPTAQHFVLVQWNATSPTFDLVVVNLAPHASQCYAPIKLPEVTAASWTVNDLAGPDRFIRKSNELKEHGLYLDLPAHGGQILHFEPAAGSP
jgi:hypothetical protein